jgi:hypothetical protein
MVVGGGGNDLLLLAPEDYFVNTRAGLAKQPSPEKIG